jgi:hypothetical protein
MLAPEVIFTLLLTWPILVVLQVFIHSHMQYALHDRPIYVQWFIVRGMVAIFHAAVFGITHGAEWYPILFWQLSTHFVIFNPLRNKLARDHEPMAYIPFWYLGQNSGWLDKFFIKRLNFYKTVYFMSIAVAIISAIVIFSIYV